MRNSLPRITPDFARSSFRNFVWNWYAYTGRSRYDAICSVIMRVIGSSWVIPSPVSPPDLNSVLNQLSIFWSSQRSVFCQVSLS